MQHGGEHGRDPLNDMDTLQIRLLGDFSIKVREEPVAALNKPRLQSLLAYLLLHHEVPQFRYYLANLLWPDSSETQALTNRQTVLSSRRTTRPCSGIRPFPSAWMWMNFNVSYRGIPLLNYRWKI
jgi:hypothetical protein